MTLSKLLTAAGVLLIALALTTAALVSGQEAEKNTLPPTITGTVVDARGPVAGAFVQIQARPAITEVDDNGVFTLTELEGSEPLILTAWAPGYYVGWTTVDPNAADWNPDSPVVITMRPLPARDNYDYHWFSFEGVEGSAACGLCHREYEEWKLDQHSQAAVNPRFLNMYTGTDINGQPGQLTILNAEGKALPPDPNQPHYGPGFLLDNPSRAGNCATCHTPIASKVPNDQNCSWSGCHTSLTIERSNGFIQPHTLPIGLKGAALDGISCDFCHKIGEVYLDRETRLPKPDMPGILSLRLFRPQHDDQIFFGTLIDVNRRDSYLPLLSQSEYCAACHYGVFGGIVGMGEVSGGTLIYNSYGEWLDSPYSDPETGQTCQDCHMPRVEEKWFVFPERGGLVRDYVELSGHTMPGAADENLLQNSVTMDSSAQRSGDQITVEVAITNDKTGHHVPTDAPTRSMILVVEAFDASGQPLTLADGPVNPAYSGDLGGLPGKTFAKVLRDEWTGEAPTGAYWRPVTIIEDTRLAALATDTTRYTFDAPAGEAVTINVRLIFRRNFYELMQQKGWTDPDILMEQATLQVSATS
jgi:hypothetical protein